MYEDLLMRYNWLHIGCGTLLSMVCLTKKGTRR
jgi:hypothetical protein